MHDKENCRQLLNSLSDYIDGDLQQALCETIDAHMADCENCRIVVDTLRKTVYLYQTSTDVPEMPTDVKERLYRRLDLSEFIDS
jgi:predicted anti-sigma-YlaC factor YlaD